MLDRRRLLTHLVWALALATAPLWADPGDVESSQDYPDFPRLPGFTISDYDEDNPSEFNFPVARPLPIDSSHLEMVHVKGHRYIIRYELPTGTHAPSLLRTQQYYEKLASGAGYTIEKNGAIGTVNETFHKAAADHDVWVYLETAITVDVVTVVESAGSAPPPRLADGSVEQPTPVPAVPAVYPPDMLAMTGAPSSPIPPPAFSAKPTAPSPEPMPEPGSLSGNESASTNDESAPEPDSASPSPGALPGESEDDSLYASLSDEGRVIVPFVFKPGKDDLAPSSQPLVDRVAAMMKRHPDLFLRIEGHTDNTGDSDANLRLSAQRAIAIEDKLVDANVDKKRIDAVGVGGLQPLADNDTPEGREKNRRIELVMWKKGPAFHAPAVSEDVSDDTSASDTNAPIVNGPTFHAPAPNGNNYYPTTSSSAKN